MFSSCQLRHSRGACVAHILLQSSRTPQVFAPFFARIPKPTTRSLSSHATRALLDTATPKSLESPANDAFLEQKSEDEIILLSEGVNKNACAAPWQGRESSNLVVDYAARWNCQSTVQDRSVCSDNAAINQDTIATIDSGDSAANIDSDVSPFQLSPAQANRMRKRIEGKNVMQERKANWNSLLKSKGTWSYDWRIPLLELQRSYEAQARRSFVNPEQYYYLLGDPVDYSQTPAEQIPRPNAWSKSKFAAYVDALAMARVPRVMQRFVYNRDEPGEFKRSDAHVFRVRDTLLALFEDRALQSFLSSSAFDIAFVFFYRNNMTRSSRKLFNIMAEQKIPILPNTFNIMLWGAAKRRDLHNFTYLLRLMVRQNIPPNENTWIAFLAAVDSEVVKLTIVNTMNELGLLKSQKTLQMAVVQLVEMEVKAHARSKAPIQTLIEGFERKYGKDWLSIHAANKICEGLGETGLLSQIPEFLSTLSSTGSQPDNVTLGIILCHCMRAQNCILALHVLKLFHSLYDVTPTQVEYGYLFMLGWTTKSYNACRVIWRIACVEAAVPYRMEELVFRSLIRNTPEIPKNQNQRWMKDAGKVIVGVSFNLRSRLIEGSTELGVMQALTEWSPSGSARTQALKTTNDIFTSDLASSRILFNNQEFIGVYEKALKLDEEWQHETEENKDDIFWKLKNAMQIDFQPKIRKVWAKGPDETGNTPFQIGKIRKHLHSGPSMSNTVRHEGV